MRNRKRMSFLSVMILTLAISVPQLLSQQTSSPGLQQRSEPSGSGLSAGRSNQDSASSQDSTLPDDVSGSYEFDHRNESIEVDLDRNNRTGRVQLSGYISRLGDDESDSTTPLTFFFDKTSIDGSQIEFQTRVVHGIWYSFQGTIFRGRGKTRSDAGYYVLHGTLYEHHPQSRDSKSADETVEGRIVDFKSLPQ